MTDKASGIIHMFGFEVGRIYKRRKDIHGLFGGQQQGGISTPRSHPVVIAFTGSSGVQHGYEDGWSDCGVFNYFGEGQVGPMTFTGGNKAIRDHVEEGKELLVFEKVRRDGSVRFMGVFACIGFEYKDAPDRERNVRQAIVFHLVPQGDFADEVEQETDLPSSLTDLRDRAYLDANLGGSTSTPSKSRKSAFKRSLVVKAYALRRADGFCEYCDEPAPFLTQDGKPFLEVHHIMRLSDGGPDRPDRVAAVCPNCHRAAHYSGIAGEIKKSLLSRISEKEQTLGQKHP